MLLLVQIDLSDADIAVFEAYEDRVLALLGGYGARLDTRLRSKDGSTETHVLEFPDVTAFEGFRADPARLAMQAMWESCGAVSVVTEVDRVA
jgi:hypothetical protein